MEHYNPYRLWIPFDSSLPDRPFPQPLEKSYYTLAYFGDFSSSYQTQMITWPHGLILYHSDPPDPLPLLFCLSQTCTYVLLSRLFNNPHPRDYLSQIHILIVYSPTLILLC